MDPVYFMAGLGLDAPVLDAIRESLPVYQALRQLVTFFIEHGFSLIRTNTTMSYETLEFRRDTTYEIGVTLQYHTNGNFLICTLDMPVSRGTSSYAYSLGEKAKLRTSVMYNIAVLEIFDVYDRDLPYDLALEMYKNRILERLYPDMGPE